MGRDEFDFVLSRSPLGNLFVTQSHGCDSSPLGIAPVDNMIKHA
jgi:hypothetical protein